jgi:hypothetical protein
MMPKIRQYFHFLVHGTPIFGIRRAQRALVWIVILERISDTYTNCTFIAHVIGEIGTYAFCHHPSLVEIFGGVADGQSQIDTKQKQA